MIPSFHIVCGSFAKEQASFFTVSINFKNSSTFQVSHHFAGGRSHRVNIV